MNRRFDLGQAGSAAVIAVRAVVATLCVLGLASLMWIHSSGAGVAGDVSSEATTPDVQAAMAASFIPSSSLHAPTSDPSLPSLEATFSRKDVTPAETAQAPTF